MGRTGTLIGQVASASEGSVNQQDLQTRFDDIEEVRLDRTRERQTLGTIRADKVRENSYSVYWETKLSLTPSLSTVAGLRSLRAIYSSTASPGLISRNLTEAEDHTYFVSDNGLWVYKAIEVCDISKPTFEELLEKVPENKREVAQLIVEYLEKIR